MCRQGLTTFDDNRAAGLCSNVRKPFALLYGDEFGDENIISESDSRPVFFFLSAGMHLNMNAKRTAREFLIPNVKKIRAAAAPGVSVLVSWGSLGAQARPLDSKYPSQSRENSATFNQRMAEFAESHDLDAVFDWWNLTKDAQTSDGLHLLTDVNMLKAQYIINWLSLAVQE